MNKPIKEKYLTKTEIKMLTRMLSDWPVGYGSNMMNTAIYPFTKVIEKLIDKGLAEPTHKKGTWAIGPTYARITEAGRKALEALGVKYE